MGTGGRLLYFKHGGKTKAKTEEIKTDYAEDACGLYYPGKNEISVGGVLPSHWPDDDYGTYEGDTRVDPI